MKLTQTDAVFSRVACMVLLCAGLWILGASENSKKNHKKSAHQNIHWVRSVARGGQRGPRRPTGATSPLVAPGGRLGGGSHPLWCPTWPPILTRRGETLE